MATASPSDPVGVARVVLGLADASPPALPGGRLVRVDGPAGSGKTTLAGAMASVRPGTRVVHMDDLYDGWEGLAAGVAQLAELLAALAGGREAGYRRYDWHEGRYREWVSVEPAPLLVVEGVGAGAGLPSQPGVLVWVSAPDDVRLRRGLERDGSALAGPWRRWLVTEAEHFARDRTAARADLLVDGLGVRPPVQRG